MTNTLKLTKLALIVASMATLGSAFSPAQAAGEDQFSWPTDVQRPMVTPAYQGPAGVTNVTRQNGMDQFSWPTDVQRPSPAYQGPASVTNPPRQNSADRFTWPTDVQRPM